MAQELIGLIGTYCQQRLDHPPKAHLAGIKKLSVLG
jgi:hypothetical protein